MSDMLSLTALDAIVWSFTSAAIATTATRLYTRHYVVKAFGLDDGLILFGQIVAIALAAVVTWSIHLLWEAYNVLLNDVVGISTPYPNQSSSALSGFISGVLYIITIPIIKCSILAFYRRIAPSRKQRLSLYLIALVILVQAIICFMLMVFSVDPPTAWFDITAPNHNFIISVDRIQVTNSAFQVLYDIILLLLPLPIIIKTKFVRHDRAALIVIYIFCSITFIATIIRLTKAAEYFVKVFGPSVAKESTEYAYWTVIEVMTAIMCANIPSMSSYFRQRFQRKKEKSPASPGSDTEGFLGRPSVAIPSSFKDSFHKSREHKESVTQIESV